MIRAWRAPWRRSTARLRRGERTLRGVEQVGTTLYRLATEGPSFIRSTMRNRAKPEPTAGTDA